MLGPTVVPDGSSFAHAKWFHGGYLQTRDFNAGRQVVLYGRVDFDRHESKFVFFNPEFELIDDSDAATFVDIGHTPSLTRVGNRLRIAVSLRLGQRLLTNRRRAVT